MTWRRALALLVLFVALAVVGARGAGVGTGGDGGGGEEGRVTRVVDGDTVRIRLRGREETVRYIGIDTPESKKPGTPVECFARAASAENQRLAGRQRVRLRFDVERRDRYGRLLAHVYRLRDGLWVNAELVRGGYATTLTVAPNVARASELRALERRARRRGRGLWRAC